MATVLSVRKHPNADKLFVATLDAGDGEIEAQRGCVGRWAGPAARPRALAANQVAARASATRRRPWAPQPSTPQVVTNSADAVPGLMVALAPPGVTTASGVAVRAAEVRGVASAGMLCSGADAGWCAEADGILARLPPGATPGAPVPPTPPSGALFGEAAAKAAKAAPKK